MHTSPSPALLQLTLTFEELKLLLKLVNAATLPGVRSPQAEPLTPEQEQQALVYAQRSLRARDLARLTADNRLVVQAVLLSAIGVCAHAQQALLLQQVGPDHLLRDFCGAHKDGAAVTYTQPEPDIYQFNVLQHPADLIGQAFSAAGCHELVAATGDVLTVADADLRQARELAEQGALAEAAALLARNNDPESAGNLAQLLAAPHTVSIFFTLNQAADTAVRLQELTVLHTPQAAWLMTQLPEPQVRQLRPVTSSQMQELLLEYIPIEAGVVASA